jgi:phage terminase large subunit-like protein
MTPSQQEKWLDDHPESDIEAVNWWLAHYARDEQVPPEGDWFVWFIRSGRGFGKTRTGAETVIKWVQDGFKRIALVGETKADVRDTMIEVGDSSLTRVAPMHNVAVDYEPSKRRVVFPDHDAIGIVYSGDEPDQLRGPQHEKAWVDELAKFKYPKRAWQSLLFGLRIGDRPQVIVTTTPRPIPIIQELIKKPTTVDVQRSSYDNIDNLSPVFVREVLDPVRGTRLGRQEIGGEILDDNPGALWRRQWIEDGRVLKAPSFERAAVAMDPASTSKETSDECGVIGGGSVTIGGKKHFYVTDDATVRGTPKEQAEAAIGIYHRLRADCIVAEANNGGEWIQAVVKQIDSDVPVELVHASRGKKTRAQPVSTIYEQEPKRAHHVGTFPLLEDELCQWEPGMDSPNRLDALVWLATELILEGGAPPAGEVVGVDVSAFKSKRRSIWD